MNDQTPTPGTDNSPPSDSGWRELERCVMQFEAAWREDDPPDLAAFLQEHADGGPGLLIELAKVDLEHRLRRQREVTAEDYWRDFPELGTKRSTRLELLNFEVSIRVSLGQPPSSDDLTRRFPDDVSLVQQLFDQWTGNQGNPSASSATLQSGPPPALEDCVFPGSSIHQYRIEKRIGSGAFSTVFAAEDTRLHRRVAIKVLRDDVASHRDIRLRMIRESQAAAALQHPNVVAVYETGQYQGLDYIVSRLVDGSSLEETIGQQEMSLRQSVEIVRSLASALSAVYDQGIVHRDLKPANIMLEDGVPLLVDFGLAHVADASVQLTMEGDVVGTPAYMSPEQAQGKGWRGDPRSDIYSLGAVLFRLVCHRLPFDGNTAQVISQVIHREPPRPRKLNADIDRDLQTIILKCLEKDPSGRYGTAAELESDLTRYLAGQPIAARPVGWLGRALKWSRRRPAVAALVLGLILLGAFSLGVLSQLRQVGQQRDRAQDAEQQTNRLLAQASADAGRLAMSRGKYAEAITHFESSLQRDAENPLELYLRLVEAHVALRQIGQARLQLQQATRVKQQADLNGTDNHAVWLMWRAELAFEGAQEFGDVIPLMSSALQGQLSSADAYYARGISAERSEQAVENFQAAVQQDPYHHRSRRMLVIMLISLADFEAALQQIHTARQLFQDDQDFRLLESLARAAVEDFDVVEELIAGCKLDEAEKGQWLEFCGTVRDIVRVTPMDAGLAELDLPKLAELARDFEARYQPLIERHGWRFPPRIGSAFQALPHQIAALDSESSTLGTEELERVVAVHPDGSLMNLLANLYLSDVAMPSVPAEDSIEGLNRALELFRRATTTRAFLSDTQDFAWKGMFTVGITLAFQFQHDVAESQKVYCEAVKHIEPSDVKERHLRVFTLVLLNAGRHDLALPWARAWADAVPEGEAAVAARWHVALCYQLDQDWLHALQASRDVLQLEPEHPQALALVEQARQEIGSLTSD